MRQWIGIAFLGLIVGGCDSSGLTLEPSCGGLDEQTCRAPAGCAVGSCTGCGSTTFSNCYDPAHEQGPSCPAFTCAIPCSTLGESDCAARPDCRADSCPTCTGSHEFVSCSHAGDPPVACGLDCPQPQPCGTIETSADTCNARPDCHAVFDDLGVCDCAGDGCCIGFLRCADGPAACSGTVSCARDQPLCGGQYVVAYTSNCYEGCVLKTECP